VPRGPIGKDGLTPRERSFVAERRKDTASPGYVIAKRAGFIGTTPNLKMRANLIQRKGAVMAAIMAPAAPSEHSNLLPDDPTLKQHVRKKWYDILRATGATHADAIRAGRELMATIEGGYVPVQVKAEGTFTLEAFVKAMGGAPEAQGQLPEGAIP
jgi:hypothetical protein